jgi:uncharacterized protein YutE (UPF0331/DUF86 family)
LGQDEEEETDEKVGIKRMYYVNVEQIEQRIAVIPMLLEACGDLVQQAALPTTPESAEPAAEFRPQLPLVARLAQERVLHLAIELVTDVGSLLIDGFLLRDASSYEDIIEILRGEDVFPDELVGLLQELVRLRKPLVQDYMTWETSELLPLTTQLQRMLPAFETCVRRFMAKELGQSTE